MDWDINIAPTTNLLLYNILFILILIFKKWDEVLNLCSINPYLVNIVGLLTKNLMEIWKGFYDIHMASMMCLHYDTVDN